VENGSVTTALASGAAGNATVTKTARMAVTKLWGAYAPVRTLLDATRPVHMAIFSKIDFKK
jgi:hypothetical protein